jgi:hypothetical protein
MNEEFSQESELPSRREFNRNIAQAAFSALVVLVVSAEASHLPLEVAIPVIVLAVVNIFRSIHKAYISQF